MPLEIAREKYVFSRISIRNRSSSQCRDNFVDISKAARWRAPSNIYPRRTREPFLPREMQSLSDPRELFELLQTPSLPSPWSKTISTLLDPISIRSTAGESRGDRNRWSIFSLAKRPPLWKRSEEFKSTVSRRKHLCRRSIVRHADSQDQPISHYTSTA